MATSRLSEAAQQLTHGLCGRRGIRARQLLNGLTNGCNNNRKHKITQKQGMRLRQAKKIMGWCKGEGNWRSKDHRKSFWKRCEELRPSYHNDRGMYVQPSFHDIDIIRRAHTRLFRWIRKGKSL